MKIFRYSETMENGSAILGKISRYHSQSMQLYESQKIFTPTPGSFTNRFQRDNTAFFTYNISPQFLFSFYR